MKVLNNSVTLYRTFSAHFIHVPVIKITNDVTIISRMGQILYCSTV